MSNFTKYLSKNWLDDPKSNILSGLVVAFAMIPEAIAFSGIAGVDPKVGLYGAFCLSITIAILGGRRGMITSATGSTALLMTGVVAIGEAQAPGTNLGLSYLIAAGLLTGVFSNTLGISKAGLSNEVCTYRCIKRICKCSCFIDISSSIPSTRNWY